MSDDILFEVSDGIARVTLNRPEARNATSAEMLYALTDFLRQVEHDPAARAVLITAKGEHFMAGGDVKGFQEALAMTPGERRADFEGRVHRANPLFLTMERMPQPVVVAVRGFAAGSAVSFVAGADLAIASDTAQFLLAHVHLGMPPDAGTTYILPRVVGLKKAKQMAFLGERIGAQEALEMGMVNWVVPDAELDAKAEEIARKIANGPARAYAEGKALMNASMANSFPAQLLAEAEAFSRCAATDDFIEGASSFAEKRKPQFKGR